MGRNGVTHGQLLHDCSMISCPNEKVMYDENFSLRILLLIAILTFRVLSLCV